MSHLLKVAWHGREHTISFVKGTPGLYRTLGGKLTWSGMLTETEGKWILFNGTRQKQDSKARKMESALFLLVNIWLSRKSQSLDFEH